MVGAYIYIALGFIAGCVVSYWFVKDKIDALYDMIDKLLAKLHE